MKKQIFSLLAILFLLSACTQTIPAAPSLTAPPAAPVVSSTPQATKQIPSLTPTTPIESSPAPLPSPTPAPRSLTICMGAQPETLYIYGGNMLAMQNILAAIYDGPINTISYSYQPVILEKIPSLADGSAVISPVAVQENDRVVTDAGEIKLLKVGQVIRPYGCNESACAVAWDGSPLEMAQLSVTFTLLEGLKWSDGEPLTARDSVFSFNIAAKDESLTDKTTIHRTASYAALDERLVQWIGLPGFLDPDYQVNFYHPLPAHQLDKLSAVDLLEAPESARYPLGWGAYMIKEYKIDRHIKLIRNPYYFRSDEGLPYFDQVIFRFFGQDQAATLSAIQNGECDILDQEASLPLWGQTLLDLDTAGKLKVHITAGIVWEHVDFNLRPLPGAGFAGWDEDGDGLGPFDDVRLRQAVALCINRQALVDSVWLGRSYVMDSYLPPDHPLSNPDGTRWAYDPASAADLLDTIGWLDQDKDAATPRLSNGVRGVPDGTPLEFAYETTTSTERQQAALLIAENLAQCGIKITPVFYPASEWFADGPDGKLFGRQFDLSQFAWIISLRPGCDLYLSDQIPGSPEDLNPVTNLPYTGWGAWNVTGYGNPEYDDACQSALQTLPGTLEYIGYHTDVQAIFTRDLPAIPLYPRLKWIVTRPDLCGCQMDATAASDFWNIEVYTLDCP